MWLVELGGAFAAGVAVTLGGLLYLMGSLSSMLDEDGSHFGQ